MPQPFKLKTIYEKSIRALVGRRVDLSTCGTPGEIRFIDCEQVTEHNTLRIYEIGSLFPPKDHPYATVSYVWYGYPDPSPPSTPRPTFNARGSERAEGISTALLSYVCAAALHEGVRLLWLDRLCIMQTNWDDKAWQIQQMYHVYKRAAVSFVLPAGISRVARLGEDTPWIHRAWTLQELLAPEKSLVLFAWAHGRGTYSGATSGRVVEVVKGKCAMADADDVLQLCVDGKMSFAPASGGPRSVVPVRVFGHHASPQVWATMGALRLRGSESGQSAVWRSALMRTSSRPVDMILSIMGLFRVSLNPKQFDADDRVAATLALAKGIMDARHSASWIGASFHLPPSSQLSSFPTFPQSIVSGRATVKVDGEEREVSEVMDGSYMSQWWLREAPYGVIDEDGYLCIRAKAASITLTDKRGNATPGSANRSIELRADGKTYYVKDLEGKKWIVDSEKELTRNTKMMIVYVGVEGRLSSLASYKFSDYTPVRAIAVKRHLEGKWHRVASFFLGETFREEVKSWETFTVAIGGPRKLTESQLKWASRKEHKAIMYAQMIRMPHTREPEAQCQT
ncbi:hypothetical protein C8T65DRAFT_694576 [Cerioporus squamosus]|nr:hypothetical protein C8T65DRAFT_694576 [Cerioporus squamosus]